MSRTDTQGPVRVRAVTPGYWRATFANPPINLFDPDVFAGLRVLLERIKADDQVRVLVGSIEQWADSVDVLANPGRRAALRAAYLAWIDPA
jgi:hypothetical protein